MSVVRLTAEAHEDEMRVDVKIEEVYDDGTTEVRDEVTFTNEDAVEAIIAMCVIKRLVMVAAVNT